MISWHTRHPLGLQCVIMNAVHVFTSWEVVSRSRSLIEQGAVMSSGDCKLGRSCFRFLVGAWWGQFKRLKEHMKMDGHLCRIDVTSVSPPALILCLLGTLSPPPSRVRHLSWSSCPRCTVIPHWGFSSIFSVNEQSCRAEAASGPVT